jgi:uncharacterized cupin superfamily protein
MFDTFAVLKPDLSVDQLGVGPSIYQQLDTLYHGFRSHVLVSAHSFTEDWGMWEQHPAGDEIVVLLTGKAEFLLRHDSGDQSVVLSEPGAFVVVPQAVWHTARIAEPTTVLFITPGEGTANESQPTA